MGRAVSGAGRRHQVRIVAGKWRGRRLEFPDVSGLRPTPDRVRETLFNWLQPWLPGAECLDLFAGSGVLGFEAVSRGAAHATLVEVDARAVAALRANAGRLHAAEVEVVQADALAFLGGPAYPCDIVFLDPPYADDHLGAAAALLEAGSWLKPNALIYLEARSDRPEPPLPANWELIRSKTAGQVGYHLARRG